MLVYALSRPFTLFMEWRRQLSMRSKLLNLAPGAMHPFVPIHRHYLRACNS